ncbi:MAG: type II toxin-antitoxin system prevent-host-death family antitoxin [Candidatus Micrarchaeaceae archaeon]
MKRTSRNGSWSFEDAQENFEEMLDLAETEGPQLITRGEDRFYMVSIADWRAAVMGDELVGDVSDRQT